MNGRVATLRGYDQAVALERFEVPEPEPGGMIVKVAQAAICGSDLHIWRGETAGDAPPSALGFGHEGFGRIVALGPGTETDDAGVELALGDRVVHHVGQHFAGRASRGRPAFGGTYGEFPYFFSTFGDYFYISDHRPAYRVPDELDDDVLAPVNCAMGAAISALIAGGTTFGSRVVILGAGGLGLTAAAAARDMGAASVIVSDLVAGRLELARRFGATDTIDASQVTDAADRVALVREFTGGRGADVVLELAGLAALLPEGVAMLGPRGTFVETGLYFTGTTVAFDPSLVLRGEKRIVGSAGYPPALLPTILDFLVRTRDQFPWERMVSHRFALEDINDALKLADWSRGDPTVTRAVVVP